MCQHSAKTDAKSVRSSSKRSDNWLLNCVITNVSMVRVSSSDPRGIPGPLHRGLYNAGVVESDTGATTLHVHVQDMQTLTWTLVGKWQLVTCEQSQFHG